MTEQLERNVEKLQRENRVLKKKLTRSEKNRETLEESKDRSDRLYKTVIEEMNEQKALLAQREKQVLALMESAPDATIIVNVDGTIRMANREASRLFGYTAEEMSGEPIEMLIPDRFRDTHIDKRRRFVKESDGRPMGAGKEVVALTKAGREFHADISLSPIETEQETIVYCAIRDITDRIRVESELARRLRSEKAVASISRALLGSDTEAEILENALRQLVVAAHVDRVHVFENIGSGNDEMKMRLMFESCAPGIAFTGDIAEMCEFSYRAGLSRWQTLLGQNQPVMGAMEAFPEEERHMLEARKVLSTVLFPLQVSGNWFGFVGFEDTFERRGWTPSDVALLSTVSEIIGAFLERRQVQEEMRNSEERIRTILHSISTGIIVIDPKDRTIADINPVAAEMIGLPREEIVGKVCHQFICPKEINDCPVLDLEQEIDNAERVLLTAEGSELPILKTVVPVILGGKKHLLESFVDISERKVAEEELKRNLEELERFNKLTINREEKMIRLKEEINQLLASLGKPAKYKIVE